MKPPTAKVSWIVAGLLFLSLCSGALLKFATPHGLTVWSVDSVVYLESADNILKGEGFTYSGPWAADRSSHPNGPVVLTHYTPLYPLAIAAFASLSHTPLAGAHIVNLLSFISTVFLAGLLVLEATPRRPSSALFAALLVGLNALLLTLFSNAFSEVMFLPLGLAGQWALVRFSKPGHFMSLVTAAILLGLTAAARYSGVVWLATGFFWLLFWSPGEMTRRLKNTILFTLIAGLPFGAFLVRNHLHSGAVADRPIAWHPIGLEHWREALETLSSWFLPWRWTGSHAGIVVLLIFFVLFILGYVLPRRSEKPAEPDGGAFPAFYQTTIIFIFLYLAHLIVSISIADYSTPLDWRILSPVLVSCICFLAALSALSPGRVCQMMTLIGCLVLTVTSAMRTKGWIMSNRQGPVGYLAPNWLQSSTAKAIRNLSPGAAVYSNRGEQIYFSLRRPALPLPFKRDPLSLKPTQDLDAQISTVRDQIVKTGGLLVYMGRPKSHEERAGEAGAEPQAWDAVHEFTGVELEQRLSLEKVSEDENGEVFRVAPEPRPAN